MQDQFFAQLTGKKDRNKTKTSTHFQKLSVTRDHFFPSTRSSVFVLSRTMAHLHRDGKKASARIGEKNVCTDRVCDGRTVWHFEHLE